MQTPDYLNILLCIICPSDLENYFDVSFDVEFQKARLKDL